MRILLVVATQGECTLLKQKLDAANGLIGIHKVELLITGIGMVNTAWTLGRELAKGRYDLVVNLGICGTFVHYPLGSIVEIVEECYGELGAEDDDAFLDLQTLGFINFKVAEKNYFNVLPNPNPSLAACPKVKGLTVNRVHGRDASITEAINRWQPEVETMEGAAFFQSSLLAQIPFVAFRGVSNRVERRNRAAWQIGPAVEGVQDFVWEWLLTLPA